MLNLFAITAGVEPGLYRFALTQGVQAELTARLKEQTQAFNAAIADTIPFDGKYKPDDDEVLYLQGVGGLDDLKAAVVDPLGIPLMAATAQSFESIKGLFSGWTEVNGAVTLIFQNFDRRRVISTDGFSIYHAANVFRKIEGIGLTIDTKLAAVLDNDVLKFKSFHNVRQILDLASYYVEATDLDIAQFAAQDTINVEDMDALVEMSDSWTRRKIALIHQSQILTKVSLADISVAALEFGIPISISKKAGVDAIDLPVVKKDLKKLLRFLDEDYYKSPLSETHFLTNSKRLAD